MYITARAALEQVEPGLSGSGANAGLHGMARFREIALPLAWPGVLAGTILSFARALGEFGATLMIAGNIPGRTETIPIAIYFAVEADDIQRALYWCAVDVIISLALLSRTLFLDAHARIRQRSPAGSLRWRLTFNSKRNFPILT